MVPNSFNKGVWKNKSGCSSNPQAGGHCIIVNFCDTSGEVWDKESILGSVKKRWPKVAQEYRRWYLTQYKFLPGEVQEVNVQSTVCHLNVLVKDEEGEFIEDALEKAIDRVGELAYEYGSSVHVQQQGSEKNWKQIQNLLIERVINRSKNVTVYTKE